MNKKIMALKVKRLKAVCWMKRRFPTVKYYQEEYAAGMSKGWKIWSKDILFLINEAMNLFEGKTVLDIGCGNGEAMEILKERFEVKGYEVSESCVETCKKKGLDVLLQSSDNKIIKGKYDTIYSNHVVEHLYKDRESIEKMLDAANHCVIFITPFCSYVPAHVQYYEAKDIAKMCEKICRERNDIKGYSIAFHYNLHLPSFLVKISKVKEAKKKKVSE